MSARNAALEDKLDHVTQELVMVKQEKDRLVHKFMSSRYTSTLGEGVSRMGVALFVQGRGPPDIQSQATD